MKKLTNLLIIEIIVLIFYVHIGMCVDDPKARAIMKKVEIRNEGDNRTADMEMVLIDKHGKERKRLIRTFTKDKGSDTLKLMFFVIPADVKDTAFLTYDFDDYEKDSEQWLFIPALKKTKRIASNDKSGSFMGSDLSYYDMTSTNLEDYDYNFAKKKEIKVRGHRAWVIEENPRNSDVVDETGYNKSLLIIRQDNYFVIRSIHWVKDGGYLKFVDVKKLELIDNIWVGTEKVITKKLGKSKVHTTILQLKNVKFNQPLGYELFTTRRMEKGL